ncbi:MAG: aldehyde ferredoxin oxidoreductase C-terminal domain-containing protein, partial [Candidatus Brocadiia bacterium]|nr:aldehyde ferredoxin oxidoreductase C-terminal domain-containing protein [Candidatus Brocadiia bacterium]
TPGDQIGGHDWLRAAPANASPHAALETTGPHGLSREDLDMMIAGYYRARGWTENGQVPDGKVRELGLAEVLEQPVPAGLSTRP